MEERLPFEPKTEEGVFPGLPEGMLVDELSATTALIDIRPDVDPKVVALYQEGLTLQQYAEAQIIVSEPDVKIATDNLTIIKGLLKAIEEKRKEYTGPLNDHLRAFNDAFKTFVAPLNIADQITRKKVLDYRAELERVRVEEERINALREEVARAEMSLKGELGFPIDLVEVSQGAPAHHRGALGTAGTAKHWKFEIDDLAQLPREYMVPDMTKIRDVVIAMKQEGHPIPGVKAWQEASLRVTPR